MSQDPREETLRTGRHGDCSAVFDQLFEGARRRIYRPRDLVVAAGEYSNRLFYLYSGSVSIILNDSEGHEIVLTYLNRGDLFGELGLFDERHRRSALVRARQRSEIATLDYASFQHACTNHPDVLYAMLAQMTRRVRETNLKLADLAFRDVAGRIARQLLALCSFEEAEKVPGGARIRITRQELARLVGCTREVASRVVSTLHAQGLVTVNGNHIVVHDPTPQRDSPGARFEP